ncbi:MAG: alpha-L-rhamnosidase C-terminal domain-containing protein, partial [Propionicimonas sp.]
PARDERMGWTGDINVFANTAVYNMDAHTFLTKWLQDLRDTQRADGALPGVAPVVPGRFDGGYGSAGWMDAGVHVPYALWWAYGDTQVILDNYSMMKRYLDYLAADSTNHIRSTGGYLDWLNLDDSTSADVLSTAFVAKTTREFAEMAAAVGRTADAEAYQARYEAIRTAFQNAFIGADGTVKSNSQTSYVLTLMNDLAPADRLDAVIAKFVKTLERRDWHLSVGFLGVDGLLPALSKAGRSDIAYKLLQHSDYPSWGYEIAKGATTVWERWNSINPDGTFNDVGMNSFNHYAYGAVGEWMYRTMAGISALEPGYRKVLVAPEPGDGIDHVTFRLDTRYGRVATSWRDTPSGLDLQVTVPANTTAEVRLPATSRHAVVEGGTTADAAVGVRFLAETDGIVSYEVGSGSYHFRIDPALGELGEAAAGAASVSEVLAEVGVVTPPTAAPWAAKTVYTEGALVSHDGAIWMASWWTKNQRPGDPWGPWQEVRTEADGTLAWTASRIFLAGDVITYHGDHYRAKWWTRNQVPGDKYGPWEPVEYPGIDPVAVSADLATQVTAARQARLAGDAEAAAVAIHRGLAQVAALQGWVTVQTDQGRLDAETAAGLQEGLAGIAEHLSRASGLIIGALADLVVGEGRHLAGDSALVEVRLANSGTRSLTGLASTLATASGWTIRPVGERTTSVAPGATAVHTYQVDVPAGTPVGTEALTGSISYGVGGGRATLPVATSLAISPTVTVEGVAITTSSALAGEEVRAKVTLRNRGDRQATAQLTAWADGGVPADPEPVTLPAGAEVDATVTVQLPLTAVAGAHTVSAAVGATAAEMGSDTVAIVLPVPPAYPTDHVDLGNTASEQAHGLTASQYSGTNSEAGLTRRYTHSSYPGGWYEFDLAVPAGKPFALRLVETFDGPRRKTYDILLDGQVAFSRDHQGSGTGQFAETYQVYVDRTDLGADGTVRVRLQDTGADYDPSIADVWALPVADGLVVAPPVTLGAVTVVPQAAEPGDTVEVTTVVRNDSTKAVDGELVVTIPGLDPVRTGFSAAASTASEVSVEVELPLTLAEGSLTVTAATGDSAEEKRTGTLTVAVPTPPGGAVDHVDLGNTASEQAHGLTASDRSGTGSEAGLTRRYTHAGYPGGWFEFDLAVPAGGAFLLRMIETYDQSVRKTYDILVDGEVVRHVDKTRTTGAGTERFQVLVDRPELSADGVVRVRFQDTGADNDPSIADVWSLPVPR